MRQASPSRSTKAPAAVAVAGRLARFAVEDWRKRWARDLLTMSTWSPPLGLWAEPVVAVHIGRTYEIPGDGNDRFFARADARCPSQDVIRLIIDEPRRWAGFETFVAPSDLRRDQRVRSRGGQLPITYADDRGREVRTLL